ncbi:GspE/PulE family protein [Acidobacteria bacterium AH-259-A15]|nr:GspE/PulE family protein [Acidobacteria bacterium AH-259-A15]
MALEYLEKGSADVRELKAQLAYRQALQEITNEINAAEELDAILIDLKDRILTLFKSDRITIYVADKGKNEIFSRFKVGTELSEIRLPIDTASIAGYAAVSGATVNIYDAYDQQEIKALHPDLAFDKSWDEKTGFRTTQILAVPIKFERQTLGVLQLINRKEENNFTHEDENSAQEIAKILGIAFQNQQRLARRHPTKFDYLIREGVLTQDELEKAVAQAREQKTDVERMLTANYGVSKDNIGAALSEFYKCRFVKFDDTIPIPGELLHNLKEKYLRTNFWVPLEKQTDRVAVLMDDPNHLTKRDMVQTLLKSAKIEYCVGLKEDIVKFINYFFGTADTTESMDDIMAQLQAEESTEEQIEEVSESDSAIAQLANKIINDAYNRRVSDIHLEPYEGRKPMEIRFRIDGICNNYQTVPYHFKRALVSRIKIMSDLDIAERRLPQDGKIQFKKFGGRDIELRVATLPTQGGLEDVVMRILTSGEPMPLDAMGFIERNNKIFKKIMQFPYGIVLVVGPTGSGKTTTLHSALRSINTPERKIWTAEDPVEITQAGLRQVQVHPKIGFTFARAMRAFLRADPDVIMVGEMRDKETCEIGIEASLTGHLVLSTLHTNSAPETITRLLDMGMDPFNFADALLGILAQRLARTLCKDCKETYHPKEDEFQALAKEYVEEDFEKTGIQYSKDLTLYRAKGCGRCGDTGYRGRMGIHELLEGTDEIKSMIQYEKPVEEIRAQAKKDGLITLKQDGILKVFDGKTDIRQVRQVCIK